MQTHGCFDSVIALPGLECLDYQVIQDLEPELAVAVQVVKHAERVVVERLRWLAHGAVVVSSLYIHTQCHSEFPVSYGTPVREPGP